MCYTSRFIHHLIVEKGLACGIVGRACPAVCGVLSVQVGCVPGSSQ